MLTIDFIKTNFEYEKNDMLLSECYRGSHDLFNQGKDCDIYITALRGNVLQKQIDALNEFKYNHLKHKYQIEKFINDNFEAKNDSEREAIINAKLIYETISVPQQSEDFDLIVICKKSYKVMKLFTKEVSVKVELRDKKIREILLGNG